MNLKSNIPFLILLFALAAQCQVLAADAAQSGRPRTTFGLVDKMGAPLVPSYQVREFCDLLEEKFTRVGFPEGYYPTNAMTDTTKKQTSGPLAVPIEEGENEVGFVRGSRIIFQDNFEKDAIGDFPAKWNSNLGGEVKRLQGLTEKWLKLPAQSIVNPILEKNLPEHFTVEVDLLLPAALPYVRPAFAFGTKLSAVDYLVNSRDKISFDLLYSDRKNVKNGFYYGSYQLGSAAKGYIDYKVPRDQVVKVAIAVNGTRFRVFLDAQKMIDLPQHFLSSFHKYFFINAITSGWPETKTSFFYISNIVIAEAGKDERSQVLKELTENGRFTTQGILFSANSDKIDPQSNEILSQLADALKQKPAMKLRIVGHTDSDGEAGKNLLLSQKRAAAVKAKLIGLGISATRLVTQGKGETVSIADNATEEGKAKNRRVEFVVLP